MNLMSKLLQVYFDLVYNPVYDFTTARLSRYRTLQQKCLSKLDLRDNDRLLCVGLGTGNEIFHIMEINKHVNIVGLDYSSTALRKAYEKTARLGLKIELLMMDARRLRFNAESFDKVVCIHVMDFIKENAEVTSEIFRVLRNGGQFVITYPSDKEGPMLGCNLIKDHIRTLLRSGRHPAKVLLQVIAQISLGILYLPLLLRPNKRSYTKCQLEQMLAQLVHGPFQAEEDPLYQDLIVHGIKV